MQGSKNEIQEIILKKWKQKLVYQTHNCYQFLANKAQKIDSNQTEA